MILLETRTLNEYSIIIIKINNILAYLISKKKKKTKTGKIVVPKKYYAMVGDKYR